MKIKKNDTVLVLTGKDEGKTGKVLVAYPKKNRIVVDGVNVQKRHTKARSAQQVSEIKEQSGAIDASNAMVVCPACGKATRVGYKTEGEKKFRFCKKCGASLDVEVAKEAKKTTKKTEKAQAETAAPAEEKKPRKRSTKKAEEAAAKAE